MPGSRTRAAYPDDAARGRRLDELFPGRIPPRLATAISQALELGASSLVTHTLHPAILPLRTPAGRQLVHNITVRPSGKQPDLRCLLQIVDVTVVAGRERILRERQNARYDAVVGSAPDTILTLDAEGTIQLVNPAAARQFGYSPDELIGQSAVVLPGGPARVEHCLQGRPRRRSAAAAPSSSRRGARTARPAISRRRHRDGRAKAGPSSPRSCVTSTSGAWRSMRCAC